MELIMQYFAYDLNYQWLAVFGVSQQEFHTCSDVKFKFFLKALLMASFSYLNKQQPKHDCFVMGRFYE